MPATIKFDVDKARDVVKAEVLFKNPLGAAQLRAVVPLSKIRAALKQYEGRVADVSGDIDGACAGLGRRAALTLLKQAAGSPRGLAAQKLVSAAKRKRRILLLVSLAVGGGLAAYGGWRGVETLMAKRRAAKAAQLKARGVSDVEIQQRLAAQERLDLADLDKAAQLAEDQTEADPETVEDIDEDDAADEDEDDEVEGQDASGFSFKKLFKRGKKARGAAGLSTAQRIEAAQKRKAAAEDEQEAKTAEDDAKAAEDAAKDGGGDAAADNPGKDETSGGRRMHKHHRHHHMDGLSLVKKLLSTTPQGAAAVQASEIARKKKLHKSAARLAKAKKGDPKAKREIKVIQVAAKKGDPRAVAEMKRLHAVNTITSNKSLFEKGIA